ncbi:MAG TPA: DUF2249 domain-containing protein [Acidimicrobiales bacterium]|nr:DUF2249 domain-containing protein [Acidimicrobiales bacterium]
MAERDEEAGRAIRAHHEELLEGVRAKTAALAGTAAAGEAFDHPRAELIAYLAGEVLPHAAAEEGTIYRAVAAGLTETVDAMVAEHRLLEAKAEALASVEDPQACATLACEFSDLFARHVADENDVLLPALLRSDTTSLADVLGDMARAFSAAKAGPGSPHGAEAVLSVALSDALVGLARAGGGDEACRQAAATWSQVRHDHPRLAVALTALLHRLARFQPHDPGPEHEMQVVGGDDPALDVRRLAPAQRHQLIFTTWSALAPAAAFVLVNDHDPKPLRYQFAAEHPDEFSWDYLEAGPKVWKVRIGRTPTSAVA